MLSREPALPDPFKFFDSSLGTGGRVVTIEDWKARREEIKDLAQYYYFGYKHPVPEAASVLEVRETEVPETVVIDRQRVVEAGSFKVNLPEGSFRWDFSDFSLRPVEDYRDDEWGSWSAHKELLITIPAHIRKDTFVTINVGEKRAEIKLDSLEIPVKGTDTELDGPYPAVIVIGGLSTEQIATLKSRGYAYISMNTGSVYSDDGKHTGAYTELFPKTEGEYEYDSGALMGWAWGVSRIIDAMKNSPSFNLDSTRTAVTGVSRNGKAALIAAAFDDRVSVCAPCDSGAAGLSGFRFVNEGQLLGYNTYNIHCNVNRIFSRNEKPVNTIGGSGHWLSSKARDFIPENSERFPFDMHEIAALVAPRPMLAFTGENFEWVNSVSTAVTMEAVREVYEFLGADKDAALIVRDGAHANQDRDLPFLMAVMDRTFGRSDTLKVSRFDSLTKNGAAADGNGVIYPEKVYSSISEMNAVPYELDSSYLRWSRPGKYTLWCEAEFLTEGFDREAAAYSDAPMVRLTLPDGTVITEKTIEGKAVFSLSAELIRTGRYKLETQGGDKAVRTAYFRGYTLSDALRHGLNLTSTSPDGMSVGFAGRLAERRAIEAYISTAEGTQRLDTGFADGLTPVYLEAYGVSLKQKHIPEGPFTLLIKNLMLEALPGCVFELSLELTGIRQPNMFAGGALEGRALSAQGEKPTWNSTCLKNGPMPEWPLYPACEGDSGERPEYVPAETAFDTDIEPAESGPDYVKLRFSTPVNKNEFGIGFDRALSWTTSWDEDSRSVTITFDREVRGKIKLYIFRLVDKENNMIPGPAVFTFGQ